MRAISCLQRCSYGWFLLAFVQVPGINDLSASPIFTSASQAWAVRIDGPANGQFQAAGISVGPSGDVFVAGHARNFGSSRDLLTSRRSPSGAFVWEKRYEPAEGPMASEMPFDILARGTNLYVAAAIRGTDGNQDFLTLKYQDTGTLEWAVRLDGAGHSGDSPVAMAVDGQGNVLVLGNSTGTNGSPDIVVLKYGPSGDLLWTHSYDGPEHGGDFAAGIRLDAGDNVYVTGTLNQWSSPSSMVTFKLSPAGQEVWAVREGSSDVNGVAARDLDLGQNGDVVIVGTERWNCMTWKYDASGNRQWGVRYRAEEPASMHAAGVRFDGDGNIITAANLYGSGTNDAVLIKYADDGQQLWATRIAGPEGVAHLQAFDVDDDGNSYLTASPGPDVITVKVSPDGTQLWTTTYNSQGFFYDYGEFLELTPTGEIFVAGRSVYSSESFVSLVKYTQQPVTGVATAVVTPALQAVDPGTDVVFTAATTGLGPIQFQWRMNGRAIPEATNPTLALTNVQVVHRGDYSVVVSNPAGTTVSPEARLSVRVPPQVSIAPTQTVAFVGTDTAFLATVAGNDFATLQWRHNGTNVPSATNEILRLGNLSAGSGGVYDIVVSTLGGTTTSSAAGLRISGAIELVEVIPHQSGQSTWEYAPQLQVLPNGEFLIAARSDSVEGSSIALYKHAADGALLWSSGFDSAEFTNAEPSRLALDGGGNIYIVGSSRQPYLTAALAVLKYSPSGQFLWSRFLTMTNVWGSVYAFAVDPDGNSSLGVLGMSGVLVKSYDSAGDVRWSFEDPSPDNDTIALAVDATGSTYLGTTIRVGGENEIRLRKFDSTGSTVWTLPDVDGMYNRLGTLAVDSLGNLIVAGTGELPNVPDSRMFVIKYSPSGQKLWETRTGSWSQLAYIVAIAVGPGDEITVLTESDDDYEPGEQSGVTRIGGNGQLKYRIAEPEILVSRPSQLALDNFGNAYVTGYGTRPATEVDAVTAKYDAHGNRSWLVYHGGLATKTWQYGLAVGADAVGDIRVLTTDDFGSDLAANFNVVRYRQRDPAGTFRVQLIPDAGGTFHIATPTEEPFRIEVSTDLQSWSVLSESESQQLLQPGGGTFSSSSQRFFRLIFAE